MFQKKERVSKMYFTLFSDMLVILPGTLVKVTGLIWTTTQIKWTPITAGKISSTCSRLFPWRFKFSVIADKPTFVLASKKLLFSVKKEGALSISEYEIVGNSFWNANKIKKRLGSKNWLVYDVKQGYGVSFAPAAEKKVLWKFESVFFFFLAPGSGEWWTVWTDLWFHA